MKVVAIIPCRDEEGTIGGIVARVLKQVDEVIVVDNCSLDNTGVVAGNAGAIVLRVDAKGAGVATSRGFGFLNCLDAGVVVTLDGDGQHDPDELPKVIKPILDGKADLVIGSRFMGGNSAKGHRMWGNRIIRWLYNVGATVKVSDAQSCYRAHSRKVLGDISLEDADFGFSVEMLIKARVRHHRIAEVPIRCIYHRDYRQNSTLGPLQHGLQVIAALLKWRLKLELKQTVWHIAFSLFRSIARKLVGKGLGKIPFMKQVYIMVAGLVVPEHMWKVDVGGYSLSIRPELGALSVNLMVDGVYEPMSTKVFKSLIKEKMMVVDVGANVGYFTLLAASLVGKEGRVLAIEPEPRNYNELVDNIKANDIKNVRMFHKAMSDRCGFAPMYLSAVEWGEHSLLPSHTKKKSDVVVSLACLDDIVRDMNVDLLKIDTEGNEFAVLQGASKLIQRNDNLIVVVEFWPAGLRVAGHNPQEIWVMLEDMGFKHIKILDEFREEIAPGIYDDAMKRCAENDYSVNLLCSRKELKING